MKLSKPILVAIDAAVKRAADGTEPLSTVQLSYQQEADEMIDDGFSEQEVVERFNQIQSS